MSSADAAASAPKGPDHQLPRGRRWPRAAGLALAWIIVLPFAAWAAGAIWFDLPPQTLRAPLAITFLVTLLAAGILVRPRWLGPLIALAAFGAVLAWWLTLRPSNDRDWQPDVAVLPWAEFEGDSVTVHNVRRCEYRTETDYDVRLEDRVYDLNRLTSLDLFLVHWGSPLIAHTMVSFGFDDGRYLCFSIEVRKKKGDAYSSIRGFFRQYEILCVIADERDLVWLRTNVRRGEDVRLYRLKPRPDVPRKLLTRYLDVATRLRERPMWYNAVTTNCTTSIILLTEDARGGRVPRDWRMLFNGRFDEFLYENGRLAGDGPFERLREAALVNPRTKSLRPDEDFSRAIRVGLPGF